MPIHIDMTSFETIGFAVLWLLIGNGIRDHVNFFQRFAIPSPVIGGFLFAIINLLFKVFNLVDITFDVGLQNFFMTLFFTSIGFGASLFVLRTAGPKVLSFLGVATLLVVFQNFVALGVGKLIHVPSAIALMTGSTAMTGGHGTAGGIAPIIEQQGISGASVVAYTAATFGLIAGSLLGGPLANRLIVKHDLLRKRTAAAHTSSRRARSTADSQGGAEAAQRSQAEPEQMAERAESAPEARTAEVHATGDDASNDDNLFTPQPHLLAADRIEKAFIALLLALFFGSFLTKGLNQLLALATDKASFPVYMGPMLVAIVMRYISDRTETDRRQLVANEEIAVVGDVSLNIFLSMALISIDLYQLADLALPMLILLLSQLILMAVYAYFVTFRVMGSNYDAAVLAGGHCGFGMGATPNGVANMQSICNKFVYSRTAFFVLPIVGGMFIDLVNITVISVFLGFVL